MALIKCPNCGKEISEKSFKCLHCDFKIDTNYQIHMKEDIIQENNASELDYNKTGKIIMITGWIAWIIGFIRLFIYGDVIIFAGMTAMGGALMISGPLIMIYDKLNDKSKLER